MVHAGEDVTAVHGQQPATGGDVDELLGFLADHWEEAGLIHKASTLPIVVCQTRQPFLRMVLLQLFCQTCWTVSKCPIAKQCNDTDVTSIPEMHIVEVISYMFFGG